jgi:hypothetical protein
MVHVEFTALRPARFANVGAVATNLIQKLGATAHITGRRPANLGAVFDQPDALRHRVDVPLSEAGIHTMLALLGALNTGFDTALIFWWLMECSC